MEHSVPIVDDFEEDACVELTCQEANKNRRDAINVCKCLNEILGDNLNWHGLLKWS